MALSGIYEIRNILTGKVYIGSAVNIRRRWTDHRTWLDKEIHANKKLQRAWIKYGQLSFEFKILELVGDKNLLVSKEQQWLDSTQAHTDPYGYNICKYAGSTLGLSRTPWNKGLKTGPESEEVRRKKSLSHTGVKRPPFTPEHRRNMSLSRVLKSNKLEDLVIETRFCRCGCGESFTCQRRSKRSVVHGHSLRLRKIPWNKGRTKKDDPRIQQSALKMAKTNTGRKRGPYQVQKGER